MSFLASLRRAKAFLEEQQRASVRALSRELGLDGEDLEELIEELVDVQRVATRDGMVIAWAGPSARAATPQGPAAERSPRDYTPRHLADRILTSKSALEGERKQVTVLFADVQGSMELAEQLDPEVWHRILERFFEILTDGIHRFEGTVNQYTGDGIMALFGAPLAHEDHAQRACFAALSLQEELARYATEVKRTHGKPARGISSRSFSPSAVVRRGSMGTKRSAFRSSRVRGIGSRLSVRRTVPVRSPWTSKGEAGDRGPHPAAVHSRLGNGLAHSGLPGYARIRMKGCVHA